jgi:hypothetical protein
MTRGSRSLVVGLPAFVVLMLALCWTTVARAASPTPSGSGSSAFVKPPASDQPAAWVSGAASASPGASVDALGQAGFGAAQLESDTSSPSASQAAVTAALAAGRRDGITIDPNVAGHQAFASPALT